MKKRDGCNKKKNLFVKIQNMKPSNFFRLFFPVVRRATVSIIQIVASNVNSKFTFSAECNIRIFLCYEIRICVAK